MSIFSSRNSKKQPKKKISNGRLDNKTQFNVVIDKSIKEEVQKMRKILRVNQSEMSEHLLEVGLHHSKGTLKDPGKRKLLEKHMETSHLLNEHDQDEDVVIRMTENNKNWILLDYTRKLTIRINRITQTMQKAVIMKDMDSFDEAKEDLNRVMAKYATLVLNFMRDEE